VVPVLAREGVGLVGGGAVGAAADGGDGAGVDDLLQAGLVRGPQHGLGTLDVDLVDLRRVGEPDRVDGGEVVEGVAAGERGGDAVAIVDVTLDDLDVEAVEVAAWGAGLEVAAHGAAAPEELADDGGADEAARAGDQSFHFLSSPLSMRSAKV